MVNPIRVALTAGVITVIVFVAGLWFGLNMQDRRVDEIRNDYLQMQINWNDVKLQADIMDADGLTDEEICKSAVSQNLEFGELVYEKGKKIEVYETRSEFSGELLTEKKEHNLLKLQFWLNSVNIQEKCSNAEYINIVYFYKTNTNNQEESKQQTISKILFEIKQDNGALVMLIPIAIDLDLISIDAAISKYNVDEFPAIMINEAIILHEIESKATIQKLIDSELTKV